MRTHETFLPVPGYEDTYLISNLGRIKTIKTGRIRRWAANNTGYYQVQLYRNGARKAYLVHRLVLMTFVGDPPEPHYHAHHVDADISNNTLANLEWCTPAENYHHRNRNQGWTQ